MTTVAGGRVKPPIAGRTELDSYATPACATLALLEREKFKGRVWEPAAGEGYISRVLRAKGYKVDESDIISGVDFLCTRKKVPNIITNPPYSLATQFVEHAINSADKVAMLMRLAYLGSKERHDMFMRWPVSAIHVISGRLPYQQQGEWYKGGGQFDHAWFIFDRGYSDWPIVTWVTVDRNIVHPEDI